MEVRLKPHRNNKYPLHGVLIKGISPTDWLKELEEINFSLGHSVYALPGLTPNSVWGCLAISRISFSANSIDKHEVCQKVSDLLYITERSTISPILTVSELEKLFLGEAHLYHPEIGLVPLGEPVNWVDLILDPIKNDTVSIHPQESIFVPQSIEGFYKQPIPKEEIEKELSKPVVPKKIKTDPLSLAEKAKLKAYKAILGNKNKDLKTSGGSGHVGSDGGMLGGAFGGMLGGLLSSMGNVFAGLDTMTDGMVKDMEELERRNQNELEKLFELLKDNPEEALKYAIPLDNDGTMRGGDGGLFNMTRMRNDLSLFGNDRSSGFGGSLSHADQYAQLLRQYNAAAEKLIQQKKYEKAAFIYMKLLKNFDKAAETLLLGKFYEQAAYIYLKYAKNKHKAAECYEKGLFYDEAIELYMELRNFEKAGDLLLKNNQYDEAMGQYDLLAEEYIAKSQYVKASFVYKNKMNAVNKGQDILFRGWVNKRDAFNCLNNYFEHYEDKQECIDAITFIYENHTDKTNSIQFIKVLTHEYRKKKAIQSEVREIAYQAISETANLNPSIVDELTKFNEKDKELKVDTTRYKTNVDKRRKGLSDVMKRTGN